MKKVRIVTATAKNQVEFFHMSLLGQSLGLLQGQAGLEVTVFFDNAGSRRKGLGEIYNTMLTREHAGETLLFVHDDVYIHDWHLAHRLHDALERHDVVGLAGNAAPDFDEPSWALAWNRDKHPRGCQPGRFLSGAVGHLVQGRTHVSNFGAAPRECLLLDGLFLAVNTEKALQARVRFDEQFAFHFYDLDFCRQCHVRGLKLGTWPIAVTHASRGAFGSPEWVAARGAYLLKWRRPGSEVVRHEAGR